MLVLGIESSCDETAAAIVRDGLAVTQGPGLVGSLLVGVCYAKGLALALGKPIVGVNHIEGHVYSVNFENPPVEYPALALIVSGGHTNLFHVPEEGRYRVVSRTRDDAAGEAYDKVAKMLGLGYPGGPIVESLAREGVPGRVRFPIAKISDGKPDYSFSGLKTAVSRYIRENSIVLVDGEGNPSQDVKDIARGFQDAVIKSLLRNIDRLAGEFGARTLIVAGGVACNGALREASEALGGSLGIPVYFPSKHLSTDNAAMIAAAGHFHLMRGESSDDAMGADVTMRLQNIGDDREDLRRAKVKYKL